jgi:hypothetical protein
VLPNAVSSERLGDRWHHVSFAAPTSFYYVGMLQMLLVMTAGSSVVAIPLALGVHHLDRKVLKIG